MKFTGLLFLPLAFAKLLPGNRVEREKVQFKALTYNAVMVNKDIQEADIVPGIPPTITMRNASANVNKVERRDKIIQQLLQSESDVICLQEVMFEDDVQSLVDGVNAVYPHSFSSLHSFKDNTIFINDALRVPMCDYSLLNSFFGCLESLCPTEFATGRVGPELTNCGITNCLAQYALLTAVSGQDCIICLRTTALELAISTCSNPVPVGNGQRINTPALVLLSKKPLTNRAVIPFYPGTLNNFDYGLLEALYDGHTKVVCTHLTPNYPVPTTGFESEISTLGLATFEAMNTHEVKSLVSRYGNDKRTVLLGDFNVGPADIGNSITGSGEENYNALKDAFNTARVSQCTFCGFPENVYNQAIFETDFKIIDHIFSSKGIRISDPQRMFLPLDADTTTSGADGNRPLSDHNGVMAEVRYCVGYFQRWSRDPGPCPFVGST